MRQLIATILGLLVLSIAYAGSPGERLGVADVDVLIEGVSVEEFLAPFSPGECSQSDPSNPIKCARGFLANRMDAEGNFYFVDRRGEPNEVWRQRPDATEELVAQLAAGRETPSGTTDIAEFIDLYVDPVNGWLYVRLATDCAPQSQCSYSAAREVIRFRGLRSMLEVLKEQKRGRRGPWM